MFSILSRSDLCTCVSAAVQDAVLRVWGLGGIPLVVSCAQIRVGTGVRGPSPVVPGNMEGWMFLLLVSALVYMSCSKNMNLT